MSLPETISPLSPIPAVLLGYQQAWVSETADVALWEKSRRIGASWCDAADSVLFAAREGGQDAMYIGYSEDMTREYIDDCAMWAKAFSMFAGAVQETIFEDHLENGEKKSIKAFRIDFANGQKVLALSSRPRSIRGKQGKISIDEAAFHDDLPGLMKAALAMLIWGGKVRLISSHNGEGNYFNELVIDVRAGRLPYALHRTTFDDALDDGLYQRVCLKTGKEWSPEAQLQWRADIFARYRANADEELMVIPSQGTGIWLPRALIEARMSGGEVVRYRAPKGMALWPEHLVEAEIRQFCETRLKPLLAALNPDWRSCFGQDFARHADLSVIVPGQIDSGLRRIVTFIVEMSGVPYKAQELILFYIADRLPNFASGKLDAGGNGDYLAEQAINRYGEDAIEGVRFTEAWYREHSAPMKAHFEDGLMLLPKDDATANDLAAFRMIKGVPRIPDLRTKDATGQQRHGDSGIATMLFDAASLADYVPMEHLSSGRFRAGRGMRDFVRMGDTYGD